MTVAHSLGLPAYRGWLSFPCFSKFLRLRCADTLIVSGSETDVCVLSAVLAAVDHGYRVVAQDAVCSSSDASHDALIDLFHRRFNVRIEADSEQILGAWRP